MSVPVGYGNVGLGSSDNLGKERTGRVRKDVKLKRKIDAEVTNQDKKIKKQLDKEDKADADLQKKLDKLYAKEDKLIEKQEAKNEKARDKIEEKAKNAFGKLQDKKSDKAGKNIMASAKDLKASLGSKDADSQAVADQLHKLIGDVNIAYHAQTGPDKKNISHFVPTPKKGKLQLNAEQFHAAKKMLAQTYFHPNNPERGMNKKTVIALEKMIEGPNGQSFFGIPAQ